MPAGVGSGLRSLPLQGCQPIPRLCNHWGGALWLPCPPPCCFLIGVMLRGCKLWAAGCLDSMAEVLVLTAHPLCLLFVRATAKLWLVRTGLTLYIASMRGRRYASVNADGHGVKPTATRLQIVYWMMCQHGRSNHGCSLPCTPSHSLCAEGESEPYLPKGSDPSMLMALQMSLHLLSPMQRGRANLICWATATR